MALTHVSRRVDSAIPRIRPSMERGSECVVLHTVDQAQDDEEKQRDPAKPGKSNEGREDAAWLVLLAPA